MHQRIVPRVEVPQFIASCHVIGDWPVRLDIRTARFCTDTSVFFGFRRCLYGEPSSMNRILVVEDNVLNRDALRRRLARKGFDVLVASDGREGLKMAEACAPHLILMDLGLPEI